MAQWLLLKKSCEFQFHKLMRAYINLVMLCPSYSRTSCTVHIALLFINCEHFHVEKLTSETYEPLQWSTLGVFYCLSHPNQKFLSYNTCMFTL